MAAQSSPAGADALLPRPPWWLSALCHVPLPLLYGLGAVLSLIARYVVRYRVRVARENLRGCFPEWPEARLRQVLNAHYRSLGQVLAEAIKLGNYTGAEIVERMQFSGFEPVLEELRAGQAVLVASSHLGNWEWLLQAAVFELGVPIYGAYKPPRSEAADRLVRWLRGRLGVHLIPAKRLLRVLARQRGSVHVVGIVADQVPTSSGGRLWLRFLGRETAFFPGPAEIARICRYSSYYVSPQRMARGRYRTRVARIAQAGETLDTVEFTARYAAQLEMDIRAAPESWAWTHRRWKLKRAEGEPLAEAREPLG
jgi:KDO2-lipid IV(A) lauroyltransferase